ncbi:MAG TPA: type IV pilin N-terminal domain-containing protein [Methanoregulaceae archaeon]|nr:type IV pilin N-terminal domain-containing protein [Methanoregulaceae archaeon]
MKIQNEEAVSPVIGVILMVAITVILAAVIAAFVFGLAGTTGSSKNVGLTVVANGTDEGFKVTIQGGTDLPTLNMLNWSSDGSNFNRFNTTAGAADPTTYGVGTVLWAGSATNDVDNSNVRFIIRGTFTDGSQQVLFDRQY